MQPTAGHLATLQFINPEEVVSAGSFLRRKAVAGHAEYNQMETNLQMSDHFIRFDHGKEPIVLGDGSLVIGKDGLTLTGSGITAGAPEVDNKLYDTGYGAQLQRNWLKIPYYQLKRSGNQKEEICR